MNKETVPIWKPSHNRVSIGFSQFAFPIVVLPKDDHTDFAQEERLGLPDWTRIQPICVVVDESKCLDTPILEFFTICEHLPFTPVTATGFPVLMNFILTVIGFSRF